MSAGKFENLFTEFSSHPESAWKDQVLKELKGEPFESLIWENNNGFSVQPYYTSRETAGSYQPAFTHNAWSICVRASDSMLHSFLTQRQDKHRAVFVGNDSEKFIKGLDFKGATAIICSDNAKEISESLKSANPYKVCFPGELSGTSAFQRWMQSLPEKEKSARIPADTHRFAEKGASPAYELGISMSLIATALTLAEEDGSLRHSDACFRTSVDANYFTQIAKLRALRRLYYVIRKEFNHTDTPYVFAETTLSNKSYGDKHNNLLRTTVESMAAVAGGCNALLVHRFDEFSDSGSFSERLALNQQRLLDQESRLSHLGDVACGSYFIETYTDAIARRALEYFKTFQNAGGYFECLKKGVFERDIEKQRAEKLKRIESGAEPVIGVNLHRPPDSNGSAAKMKSVAGRFPNAIVFHHEIKQGKSDA